MYVMYKIMLHSLRTLMTDKLDSSFTVRIKIQTHCIDIQLAS